MTSYSLWKTIRTSKWTYFAAGTIGGAASSYAFYQYRRAQQTQVDLFGRPVSTAGEKSEVKLPKYLERFGEPRTTHDVLVRKSYVVSYDRQKRHPQWVAEHLKRHNSHLNEKEADNGDPDRHKSHFKEDPDIPKKFRAHLVDYEKTGYDRGHMVPAADVRDTQEALNETFLCKRLLRCQARLARRDYEQFQCVVTNVCPQIPGGFNRGYWAYFEHFVRSLRGKFDDVYVFTGPLYLPRETKSGKYHVTYQVIGDPPNISVPTHFFKLILTFTADGKPLMESFALPNTSIPAHVPLTDFIVSLDTLERSSGIEFFHKSEQLKEAESLCKHVTCRALPFKHAVKALSE